MRIPGSDVSLILVPLFTRLTLGGDCDLKAKPFGRGCGTERLAFTVSIMLRAPLATWHDHLRTLITGGERKVISLPQMASV